MLSRSRPDSREGQLSHADLVVGLPRALHVVLGVFDPDTGGDVVGEAPDQHEVERVVEQLGVQSVGVDVEEAVPLERSDPLPPLPRGRQSLAVQLGQASSSYRGYLGCSPARPARACRSERVL